MGEGVNGMSSSQVFRAIRAVAFGVPRLRIEIALLVGVVILGA